LTSIFIGARAAANAASLELKRANRHGLIAGATGTGKTVTLQGLVEASAPPASRPSSPT
jgi:DNA segregation ATPase FtsK/SpoIIIE-like protein